MNERILELAEQATQEFSPVFERNKWQEKFAELIVSECVRVGNKAWMNDKSVVPTFPSNPIKEHFGIEP